MSDKTGDKIRPKYVNVFYVNKKKSDKMCE